MSWYSSHRRERFNSGWARTRRLVLERAHYRCQWVRADTGRPCGLPATEVDHIRRSRGGGKDDDSLSNLQALCHYHHAQKTHEESVESRLRNSRRRRLDRWYSHPCFH